MFTRTLETRKYYCIYTHRRYILDLKLWSEVSLYANTQEVLQNNKINRRCRWNTVSLRLRDSTSLYLLLYKFPHLLYLWKYNLNLKNKWKNKKTRIEIQIGFTAVLFSVILLCLVAHVSCKKWLNLQLRHF